MRHSAMVLTIVLIQSAMGFVRSPFMDIPPQSFRFSSQYLTESLQGLNTNQAMIETIATFRFNHGFVSIAPRYFEKNNERQSYTQYQLGWILADSVPVTIFTLDFQLGAYSLSTPTYIQQSDFMDVLTDYAVSYRISNQNVYALITHGYESISGDWWSNYILGWDTGILNTYVAHDVDTNQQYVGLKGSPYNHISVELSVNISNSQMQRGANHFVPLATFGITIDDVFGTAPTAIPQTPLDIDSTSFLYMERGLLAFKRGDYVNAAMNYKNVADQYPTFVLAHIRLGNSYYQMNQYQMAQSAWTHAFKLDPNNDALFMALTQLQNRDKQAEQFIKNTSF